jgi:hypothetical protein
MRRTEEFAEFGKMSEITLMKNTKYIYNKFYNVHRKT